MANPSIRPNSMPAVIQPNNAVHVVMGSDPTLRDCQEEFQNDLFNNNVNELLAKLNENASDAEVTESLSKIKCKQRYILHKIKSRFNCTVKFDDAVKSFSQSIECSLYFHRQSIECYKELNKVLKASVYDIDSVDNDQIVKEMVKNIELEEKMEEAVCVLCYADIKYFMIRYMEIQKNNIMSLRVILNNYVAYWQKKDFGVAQVVKDVEDTKDAILNELNYEFLESFNSAELRRIGTQFNSDIFDIFINKMYDLELFQ